MLKLKTILNHQAFFPVLFLYYGVFYILYGEVYPYTEGMTPDGYVFSSLVEDLTKSHFFDTYYIHRIVPSLLIRGFFELFSININNHNIFISFQIFNLICIVASIYLLKKIFIFYKLNAKTQIITFILFLFNFSIIKYPFYLPVSTDCFSLLMGIFILYSYVKNNLFLLVLFTVISNFSCQLCFYQGLILIIFPICKLPYIEPEKWKKVLLYFLSSLFVAIIALVLLFILKIDSDLTYIMKIDRDLLPFSIMAIVLLYFFLSKLFLNASILNIKLFFTEIKVIKICIAAAIFVLLFLWVKYINPKTNTSYPLTFILSNPIKYSSIKPFIFIVAHASFWGVMVCLLILFWTEICKTISQFGWGLVFAFALKLFLFSLAIETRALMNIFPWLIVFIALVLNKYTFSKIFYVVIALFAIISSKIWFEINSGIEYKATPTDENGSIAFPMQKFWLNFGPWMSEQMYYIQGLILLLFTVILFFILYKVKIKNGLKMELEKKYYRVN